MEGHMSLPHEGERNRPQLRLWPGVVAVLLQWLLRFVLPAIMPDAIMVGLVSELVFAVAILVWWLFFSRALLAEKLGALALIAIAVALTPRILHPSINNGMMGFMFYMYAIPVFSLALVLGVCAAHRLATGPRRATIAAAILAGSLFCALFRTDGVTGEGQAQLAWRWTPTAEQKLLARAAIVPAAALPAAPVAKELPKEQPIAAPAAETPAKVPAAVKVPAPVPATRPVPSTRESWTGFRGPNRDGVVSGVRIKTDWTTSPPVEIWRRAVGPGWSSFSVSDGLIYTQEQRGDSEVVACYNQDTGEPVWAHRDNARFYESNGGAGPRATPTLRAGRAYTFGATGILNALDAGNGAVIWSRNAASDTKTKTPGWGFSSSPLIVDDTLIVAVGGRLAAYDLAKGVPRWVGPKGGASYSSPQLMNIGGVPQVVLLSADGATSLAPADGTLLWKHAWAGGSPILQPAITPDGAVLITTNDMSGGLGTRRLAVAKGDGGWKADEVWTSTGLKPYFNDLVVHNGHVYGFDAAILACIDLQDGKRKWKGGRYGHGQMLLLADQDLLLVLSEEGELALVQATPGQFTELARFKAMDDKTWNHPVLVGDTLLVRNSREMVAFRLTRAGT